MGMKHKTGPNKTLRILFASLIDWDRLIRRRICTEEHKANIVQDMWENDFAILENAFACLPVVLLISCCQNRLVVVSGFSQGHHWLGC